MLTVVGRLASGVSIAGAHAELDGVSRQLAIEYPDANEAPAGVVSSLRDAIQMMADQGGTSARFLLLSVAALVLVLAVINAAAVFLVRAAHQQQDLVVRVALGAPRSRLLTLLLGQSLIVSLAAGALGVLLSFWGIQIAEPRLAVSATGFAPVLDWRVIAAALTLAVIAGLAVGLLPAFRLWQSDLHGDLRARGVSGSRGGRLQRALVIAQVALALVLLSGAGALTRDFISLMTRDLGFAGDRLVVAWLPLTATHTDAADAAVRVARLPGVDAAALGGRSAQGYAYRLENGDSLTGAKRPIPYRVSADYFRTLGIPLLAGRGFLPDDRTGSTPVAIVSRLAARTWWPGEVPIGKQVEMSNRAGGSELVTIVGMTEDERVTREPQSPIRPILYRPWGQLENERRRTQIFVRTAEAESIIIPHVRAVTRSLRSGEGWQGDRVTTMTATLGNALELPRFRTSALTLFSIFGLLLAAMGIYGVVASVVSQRTPEIGIRLALGARPADVLGLVTRGGIGLAVAGMVLGLAGAFAAHRLLASVVVTATGVDLVAMLASAAFLAAVVSIACYMPGRRATRIDPTIALRE
jgi:predicted permease